MDSNGPEENAEQEAPAATSGTTGDDFEFYFQFTKPLVLELPTPEDRAIAAAWVQKLEIEPESEEEKKLRLDYLKLLLFVLQRGHLSGIFKKQPPPGSLQPFPQGFSMSDMGNLMIDQDELQTCGGGDARSVPYTIEISNDLREFVAAQEVPNFGVQMYYAWSSDDPVHKWSLFDESKFPLYVLDKIKQLKEIKSDEKTGSEAKTCPQKKKLCDLPIVEKFTKKKLKSPQEIEKSQGRSYHAYMSLVGRMGNGFKDLCDDDPDKSPRQDQRRERCAQKPSAIRKCPRGPGIGQDETSGNDYGAGQQKTCNCPCGHHLPGCEFAKRDKPQQGGESKCGVQQIGQWQGGAAPSTSRQMAQPGTSAGESSRVCEDMRGGLESGGSTSQSRNLGSGGLVGRKSRIPRKPAPQAEILHCFDPYYQGPSGKQRPQGVSKPPGSSSGMPPNESFPEALEPCPFWHEEDFIQQIFRQPDVPSFVGVGAVGNTSYDNWNVNQPNAISGPPNFWEEENFYETVCAQPTSPEFSGVRGVGNTEYDNWRFGQSLGAQSPPGQMRSPPAKNFWEEPDCYEPFYDEPPGPVFEGASTVGDSIYDNWSMHQPKRPAQRAEPNAAPAREQPCRTPTRQQPCPTSAERNQNQGQNIVQAGPSGCPSRQPAPQQSPQAQCRQVGTPQTRPSGSQQVATRKSTSPQPAARPCPRSPIRYSPSPQGRQQGSPQPVARQPSSPQGAPRRPATPRCVPTQPEPESSEEPASRARCPRINFSPTRQPQGFNLTEGSTANELLEAVRINRQNTPAKFQASSVDPYAEAVPCPPKESKMRQNVEIECRRQQQQQQQQQQHQQQQQQQIQRQHQMQRQQQLQRQKQLQRQQQISLSGMDSSGYCPSYDSNAPPPPPPPTPCPEQEPSAKTLYNKSSRSPAGLSASLPARKSPDSYGLGSRFANLTTSCQPQPVSGDEVRYLPRAKEQEMGSRSQRMDNERPCYVSPRGQRGQAQVSGASYGASGMASNYLESSQSRSVKRTPQELQQSRPHTEMGYSPSSQYGGTQGLAAPELYCSPNTPSTPRYEEAQAPLRESPYQYEDIDDGGADEGPCPEEELEDIRREDERKDVCDYSSESVDEPPASSSAECLGEDRMPQASPLPQSPPPPQSPIRDSQAQGPQTESFRFGEYTQMKIFEAEMQDAQVKGHLITSTPKGHVYRRKPRDAPMPVVSCLPDQPSYEDVQESRYKQPPPPPPPLSSSLPQTQPCPPKFDAPDFFCPTGQGSEPEFLTLQDARENTTGQSPRRKRKSTRQGVPDDQCDTQGQYR